jgi:hypothetical protein
MAADPDDDPVYRDARREAVVILAAWSLCMIWSVSYSYLHGYSSHDRVPGEVTMLMPDLGDRDRDPDSLTTPFGLGIPDWVFWGVVVPWALCIGFSAWFCFVYMTDDPEALDQGEDDRMVDRPADGGA